MAGQTVNANIAFSEFTKTMSICIFSRILYIGSLILLLISAIFLLTCYLLIVCSKFIEKLIFRMTMDYDSSIIKNVFDNTIQIISNRINDLIGWKIIPGPEIKKETEKFYDSSGDYVHSSCDETEVDSLYDSDDDKHVFSGESDEQVSVSEVSTIQTLDPEEEQEQNSEEDDEEEQQEQEQNPEEEQEPDKNEQNMISDIEDVTEPVIAEREKAREKQKIRDLIDLSSDSD